MITRQYGFPRLWGVAPAYRDNIGGMIRSATVNGVTHTWAIARPGGVYIPQCAPNYLDVPDQNRGLQNFVHRRAQPMLAMPKPHLAADPSDSRTWQRPYRFM
jgi:hypothetical protein